MLTTFFLLAYAGWIVSISFNLSGFQRATPGIQFGETVKKFFSMNVFNTIISFVVITVLCFLLNQPGSEWVIKYSTANQLDGSTPFQVYLFSFVIGLAIDVICYKIRGIVKPVEVNEQKL